MTASGAGLVRWWWVRHAPIAGPPGVIAGQQDLPADLSNREELTALARRLPRGALWITSPLGRCQTTAAALLACLSEGPTRLRDEAAFMEQHFGAWQGLTHDALAGTAEADRFWRDPAREAPPGGESFAALCLRVATAVGRWCDEAGAEDVVAIAHAGTIRAALVQALGVDPSVGLTFVVDPLHLTRLDRVSAGAWRVVGVNQPP